MNLNLDVVKSLFSFQRNDRHVSLEKKMDDSRNNNFDFITASNGNMKDNEPLTEDFLLSSFGGMFPCLGVESTNQLGVEFGIRDKPSVDVKSQVKKRKKVRFRKKAMILGEEDKDVAMEVEGGESAKRNGSQCTKKMISPCRKVDIQNSKTSCKLLGGSEKGQKGLKSCLKSVPEIPRGSDKLSNEKGMLPKGTTSKIQTVEKKQKTKGGIQTEHTDNLPLTLAEEKVLRKGQTTKTSIKVKGRSKAKGSPERNRKKTTDLSEPNLTATSIIIAVSESSRNETNNACGSSINNSSINNSPKKKHQASMTSGDVESDDSCSLVIDDDFSVVDDFSVDNIDSSSDHTENAGPKRADNSSKEASTSIFGEGLLTGLGTIEINQKEIQTSFSSDDSMLYVDAGESNQANEGTDFDNIESSESPEDSKGNDFTPGAYSNLKGNASLIVDEQGKPNHTVVSSENHIATDPSKDSFVVLSSSLINSKANESPIIIDSDDNSNNAFDHDDGDGHDDDGHDHDGHDGDSDECGDDDDDDDEIPLIELKRKVQAMKRDFPDAKDSNFDNIKSRMNSKEENLGNSNQSTGIEKNSSIDSSETGSQQNKFRILGFKGTKSSIQVFVDNLKKTLLSRRIGHLPAVNVSNVDGSKGTDSQYSAPVSDISKLSSKGMPENLDGPSAVTSSSLAPPLQKTMFASTANTERELKISCKDAPVQPLDCISSSVPSLRATTVLSSENSERESECSPKTMSERPISFTSVVTNSPAVSSLQDTIFVSTAITETESKSFSKAKIEELPKCTSAITSSPSVPSLQETIFVSTAITETESRSSSKATIEELPMCASAITSSSSVPSLQDTIFVSSAITETESRSSSIATIEELPMCTSAITSSSSVPSQLETIFVSTVITETESKSSSKATIEELPMCTSAITSSSSVPSLQDTIFGPTAMTETESKSSSKATIEELPMCTSAITSSSSIPSLQDTIFVSSAITETELKSSSKATIEELPMCTSAITSSSSVPSLQDTIFVSTAITETKSKSSSKATIEELPKCTSAITSSPSVPSLQETIFVSTAITETESKSSSKATIEELPKCTSAITSSPSVPSLQETIFVSTAITETESKSSSKATIEELPKCTSAITSSPSVPSLQETIFVSTASTETESKSSSKVTPERLLKCTSAIHSSSSVPTLQETIFVASANSKVKSKSSSKVTPERLLKCTSATTSSSSVQSLQETIFVASANSKTKSKGSSKVTPERLLKCTSATTSSSSVQSLWDTIFVSSENTETESKSSSKATPEGPFRRLSAVNNSASVPSLRETIFSSANAVLDSNASAKRQILVNSSPGLNSLNVGLASATSLSSRSNSELEAVAMAYSSKSAETCPSQAQNLQSKTVFQSGESRKRPLSHFSELETDSNLYLPVSDSLILLPTNFTTEKVNSYVDGSIYAFGPKKAKTDSLCTKIVQQKIDSFASSTDRSRYTDTRIQGIKGKSTPSRSLESSFSDVERKRSLHTEVSWSINAPIFSRDSSLTDQSHDWEMAGRAQHAYGRSPRDSQPKYPLNRDILQAEVECSHSYVRSSAFHRPATRNRTLFMDNRVPPSPYQDFSQNPRTRNRCFASGGDERKPYYFSSPNTEEFDTARLDGACHWRHSNVNNSDLSIASQSDNGNSNNLLLGLQKQLLQLQRQVNSLQRDFEVTRNAPKDRSKEDFPQDALSTRQNSLNSRKNDTKSDEVILVNDGSDTTLTTAGGRFPKISLRGIKNIIIEGDG